MIKGQGTVKTPKQAWVLRAVRHLEWNLHAGWYTFGLVFLNFHMFSIAKIFSSNLNLILLLSVICHLLWRTLGQGQRVLHFGILLLFYCIFTPSCLLFPLYLSAFKIYFTSFYFASIFPMPSSKKFPQVTAVPYFIIFPKCLIPYLIFLWTCFLWFFTCLLRFFSDLPPGFLLNSWNISWSLW